MKPQLPPLIESYVRATNSHDPASFVSLFAADAVVDDIGREFRGTAAIKAWSDREIFEAQVTVDVLRIVDAAGETVITTKVDGNFDRTGLPDPVVIDHHITLDGDKIVGLSCSLVNNDARS